MLRTSFEALLWSEVIIKFLPWYVAATTKRAVDFGIKAFSRLVLGQTALFDLLFAAITLDIPLLAIIAVGYDFCSHCKMITAIVWAFNESFWAIFFMPSGMLQSSFPLPTQAGTLHLYT